MSSLKNIRFSLTILVLSSLLYITLRISTILHIKDPRNIAPGLTSKEGRPKASAIVTITYARYC